MKDPARAGLKSDQPPSVRWVEVLANGTIEGRDLPQKLVPIRRWRRGTSTPRFATGFDKTLDF